MTFGTQTQTYACGHDNYRARRLKGTGLSSFTLSQQGPLERIMSNKIEFSDS